METPMEPIEAVVASEESPKAAMLPELANRYLALKMRVSELDGELDDAKKACAAAEAELIDLMVNELQTAGIKTADGVGISAGRKTMWNNPTERREELYAKLREDGHLRMFTVNHQTLASFTKDMAERNGGALDAEYQPFFEPFDKVSLSVRDIKKWSGGDAGARPVD